MKDRKKKDDREKKFKPRKKRRRICVFCADKKILDYKDVNFVKKFMTERGKIGPRRLTGCCAFHQRMVANVIKRARQIGLVPYSVD